jgi:hypothetical protein
MQGFLLTIRCAARRQAHKAMAEQFRVDSQAVVILQMEGCGVWQIADAQLQRRAVGNLLGNALADFQ